MSTNFDPQGKEFSSVLTGDGSPTALGASGEAMHSLEGALSETLYIYGPVADGVLTQGWPPRFLSLGLGIGYVEMMVVARGLRQKMNWTEFYLHSFESEPNLRAQMEGFLKNPNGTIYQKVLECTAQAHELSSDQVFEKLKELHETHQWVIDKAMVQSTPWPHLKFSGIFFDAFSSKTSPELWTEEFLDSFLNTFAAPRCLISTYAATGALKRTLRTQGFAVESRKGFGKKRQSTHALRESVSN